MNTLFIVYRNVHHVLCSFCQASKPFMFRSRLGPAICSDCARDALKLLKNECKEVRDVE